MQEPATDTGAAALEPLAIVGAGCRLPGGVHTPEDYWALLCEGRDAITDGPPEEWRREALAHPDAYPYGGFLDSIDGFDWRALHTSPREARFMDPQQRLALEVAWEAFEHAGMSMESLAGRRAAVAVGIMWPDYAKLQARDMGRLDGYTVTGSGFAYAANRISAFFDLLGPSFSLDVMCASSLAAVHLACQSIWSGEVDMALAAGVNLILSPDTNVAMTKARILSPDGRCKTLDERANGFVRGEGAAAIVIKPAAQAAADGDRVIALIRGTAFNHSGRNEWIMAPSREAQAAVIADACRRAGVSPAELDMVEMHGTGTEKGDPIEAAALGDTVGAGRDPGSPCRVGSVKTNIGHLDSAAGIAGLLKAALSLHHGKVPPSLHFQSPNPAIDLDSLGLAVQTELGDWPHAERRRLAGVTALAFGAANAHAVLEGPPAPQPAEPTREGPLIVPVSAESDVALGELLADHVALVRDAGAAALEDIAFTAARRRTHRAARAAAVGSTGEELAERLEEAARAVA
ncbi:MAG: beta-ketoacyl synthase N-terminal-like domain-containing protein, partial [Gaiellaceae bacterium]